jgi:hypothetical protein
MIGGRNGLVRTLLSPIDNVKTRVQARTSHTHTHLKYNLKY